MTVPAVLSGESLKDLEDRIAIFMRGLKRRSIRLLDHADVPTDDDEPRY